MSQDISNCYATNTIMIHGYSIPTVDLIIEITFFSRAYAEEKLGGNS
jgi:hypothetical protein